MDNKDNKENQNENKLFYGIGASAIAVLCFTWMKDDSFTFWGNFTVSCKTLGIILAIIGGWNLLSWDGFGNLVGEILALPFRLLGWALEHWYLVLALILLVNWLDSREEAEPARKEQVQYESVLDEPVWTENIPAETQWVPPATTQAPAYTVPPAKVYIQQPYAGMHREAGICRNLREDAMVLLVFVDDNNSSWTAQEMQTFQGDMVNPALEFITYRASEYGYGISMDSCVYPDEYGNTKTVYYNGSVPSWSPGMVGPTELVSMATETYGFAVTQDMIQNVRDYAGTDQVAIVFCLDKDGRSYAYWHDTDPDYVEYAVVFTRQNGTKNRPGMLAHEVLHLFGGDDMYGEGSDRGNRAAMTRRLHPREVFYEVQWNLYDNVISPYTAYAVGWLDYLPSQYDCPEWWS